LGQEHGDTLASVDGALGHEAASEEAGSETGVPTRTSPAAPPLSSVLPPSNGPVLVYASTQQIVTDANLTAGYEISLNSPTKYPLKQENLESCLAMARTKMENEFGASTETQFAVQISTEVRVQNLDTFTLKSDIKASEKEEEKREK
jgi:hypothetical protein